jgi:RHS repeat-associated protein
MYGWDQQGLISRTDANENSLFYLWDGLGNCIGIIDQTGRLAQSYEYSAYGECLSGKDAVNAFRFVGRYGGMQDDETGLTYFTNRWYDSKAGRWMSEDPIRQGRGLNLYAYVLNNPSRFTDINGSDVDPNDDYYNDPYNTGNSSSGGKVFVGNASFYDLPGHLTADGDEFDSNAMAGAMTKEKVPHLPTTVQVKNLEKGACKVIDVEINDRGPFAMDSNGTAIRPLQPHPTRIIDLTEAAFKALAGSLGAGVIRVEVTVP